MPFPETLRRRPDGVSLLHVSISLPLPEWDVNM